MPAKWLFGVQVGPCFSVMKTHASVEKALLGALTPTLIPIGHIASKWITKCRSRSQMHGNDIRIQFPVIRDP
jgi:hypothetical protein